MGNRLVAVSTILVLFALAAPFSMAQNPQRGQQPPAGPAPRWPDGKVNLGAQAGETGVWQGDGRLVINPKSYEPRTTLNAWTDIKDVPLQDWARALVDLRHADVLKFEPHARCKPSGAARQFVTPYGFEILDVPEQKRLYVFDIGGPHSFRIIHLDRKEHPKNLVPSYYGDSIAHWEGDTLVVDTIGFNEKFWISRDGLPHTDRLHLTERFSRPDARTLRYEITIDDPGAYTAPWTSGFNLRWIEGTEIWEYVCQDNNQFPISVFDDSAATGSSLIVP